MATIKIRRAKSAKDRAACLHLQAKLFAVSETLDDAEYIAWWLATDDEGPVGFAACFMLKGEPGVFFLARAGVLPRGRGQGLQRRLIRLRERWAKGFEATSCITYTDLQSIHSANNLIACGYKLYNPHNKWGHSTAIYFWKRLS